MRAPGIILLNSWCVYFSVIVQKTVYMDCDNDLENYTSSVWLTVEFLR